MKTDSNYAYPLQENWSTADIIAVTQFYQLVEAAYEQPGGVDRQALLTAYRAFQEIVPQKFEEKQLGREFETASGYSFYRTMKAARETEKAKLKMKGDH